MARLAIVALITLLAMPGSAENLSANDAYLTEQQENLTELQAYFSQVSRSKTDAENLLYQFRRLYDLVNQSRRTVLYDEAGGETENWLEHNTPNGQLSAPLFQAPLRALTAWFAAIQEGVDRYPPMDDIRASRDDWHRASADLMKLLSVTLILDERRFSLSADADFDVDKKSLKAIVRNKRIEKLASQIRDNLRAAQLDLDVSVNIPKPIVPSDRSESPFQAPDNRGVPDRVLIWTDQISALIGSTIHATFGVGNRRGPTSIPDKSYTITVSCEDCVIDNSDGDPSGTTIVKIGKDQRSRPVTIRVQASRATIVAQTRGLRPASASAYGCAFAKALHLATDKTRSVGPADGRTTIAFNLIFENPEGLNATNGFDRTIRFSPIGDAIIRPRTKDTGSYPKNYQVGDPIVLPGDQCVCALDILSSSVGHVSANAFYRDKPTDPVPEFDFYYALNWPDYIAFAFGTILGFTTKDVFWKDKRSPWIKALLTCLAGGTILFAVTYLRLIKDHREPYPWLILSAFTLAGSILGVGAVKLLFSDPKSPTTPA